MPSPRNGIKSLLYGAGGDRRRLWRRARDALLGPSAAAQDRLHLFGAVLPAGRVGDDRRRAQQQPAAGAHRLRPVVVAELDVAVAAGVEAEVAAVVDDALAVHPYLQQARAGGVQPEPEDEVDPAVERQAARGVVRRAHILARRDGARSPARLDLEPAAVAGGVQAEDGAQPQAAVARVQLAAEKRRVLLVEPAPVLHKHAERDPVDLVGLDVGGEGNLGALRLRGYRIRGIELEGKSIARLAEAQRLAAAQRAAVDSGFRDLGCARVGAVH